ncbi:hypothetical protein L7F22_031127 [Adiantum nelumboides]|nr:hypothetical protein [Adiantum nelumboides]
MKSRKKRSTDVPPKIKSFIASVTSVPLENIQDPLSQFSWDFEKGDFHHWVDLFHHFDNFFEKFVKSRKDFQLDGEFWEYNEELPNEALLQILRVSRVIFENCANKYLFRSHEHLLSLLASTDPALVISALETLAALVKKPAQSTRSIRWHGDSVVNSHLFSLSQGWGGKEEGLGLLSCATEGGCDADASRLGSTLHYEFYEDGMSKEGAASGKGSAASGLQVIHIPDVHLHPKNDLLLFKQLLDEFHVPSKLRFSLFTRLRFARAFHSLSVRRQFICIRLLAFTALLQSNPDHEDLAAFFVNEPEFVNELVALLQSENAVPEHIRILAVRALAAQAQDRPRQSNVLAVVSAGGHRGVLPNLVQKAVASLTSEAGICSVAFVEALLFLVTVLVSSSAGCAALREAGLIPTLLPLLKDTNPQHVDLVTSAVHILEAFMDYSNPAGTLFRDLGGLDDTIMRFQYEVSHVERTTETEQGAMQPIENGKAGQSSDLPMAENGQQPEAIVPYRLRLLLKALLRAIALGTYASGNTSRLHGSEENALPACLCSIFRHAKVFGGGVFSLAASVMSDLINKDPTCFPVLHAAGLPAAFLESISAGVLPSSDAVGCIPHALDALCLNHTGLQAVNDCKALDCFVKIFTSKSYLKALSGDTPAAIASGLDELMRHAPSLRGPGVDACINILKTIANIGGAVEESSMPEAEGSDAPSPMETDSEQAVSSKEAEQKGVQGSDSSADPGQSAAESFLPDCINNTVQMLETIFQNADTCRVFIEKKGIEELLRLFTLPCLPVSFGGSSTAYNIFLTFRAFSSQHAITLTKAVCSALKDHLKLTASSLCCPKLSDLDDEARGKVVRNLSAAECFLSLTTFLVRSLAPMMNEISSGSSDLFDDLGIIHRWVLWQVSVGENNKSESKKEEESAVAGADNNEENRENDEESEALPVLRYVNPGSRNRWGFESDMIPLLSTDQNERRSRRESVTTEILNHVARLGRLARSAAVRTVRGDLDSSGNSLESLASQEPSKGKSADTLCFEMMTRLASAARGLYGALGKAMAVPSRHRDDAIIVNPAAKTIASSLATLFFKNLEFEGFPSSSDSVVPVKCRYLGKVVDDIMSVILDARKKTCNTIMVNCFYAFGTFKQLLTTFEATSQLLWTSVPMDTETGKMDIEKAEDKAGGQSWLLDTLRNYTRLMECLVASSTLLVPSSMAQLLAQPVSGRTISIPKDPENFVLAVQAQVLEAIFPLWNHPLFPQCSPTLIESVCSIVKHVYSGVTEVKTVGTSGAGTSGIRLNPSPPDESAISVIVEMGFSRARAEEALRRVGRNSVELAMEWLFGHPEETSQEEDELARALALSLGNGNDASNEESAGKGKEVIREEVVPQLPPVESMLSTCMKLLHSSQSVTFPLADLMVTMSSRSKGEDRAKVISYLINQISLCKAEESESEDSPLSTISHLLALILSEDTVSREVAAENGIVGTAIDYLSSLKQTTNAGDKISAPKWVTALLLILDYMLQHKPRIDSTAQNVSLTDELVTEPSRPGSTTQKSEPESIQKNSWEAILGKPTGYMAEEEQKKTVLVACNLLAMTLPAETVQAILQLSARLTKVHLVAMQFLEAGGLSSLISLPRNSLFPGFDNVAAAIIRHLLEDPQTLQLAMESEIRHSLAASLSRHNNRLSPRMFLTTMARVVARDPAIFMKAAAVVCQIDESGGRPHVILAKEKEKEKEREKDKEKIGDKEKEKLKAGTEEISSQGGPKITEAIGKASKGYKKIPQSFSHVMEQLLDVVANFSPPDKEYSGTSAKVNSPSLVTAMEVDDVSSKDKGKAKVEEVVKSDKSTLSESSAALAKVIFILKLLTEFVLMYSASVTVVLRRDTESIQGRSILQGGSEAVGQGGFLHGILHRLVPPAVTAAMEKTPEYELLEKLSSKAGHFLVAVCMRSAEGRKRLFLEIAKALVASSNCPGTSVQQCSQPPSRKMRAFVDLLSTVLSSHTSSGGSQAPGVSTEMAKAMLDTGMVQALTTLLQVIDLDHPDAPKLAGSIAKVLEALTRAASSREQMHSSEPKRSSAGASQDSDQRLSALDGQPSDAGHQNGNNAHIVEGGSMRVDLQAAIRAMQALVGDDLGGDVHLDHDMGLDADGNDDDDDDEEDEDDHLEADDEEFMHDAAEVVGGLEDVAAAAMSFRMEHGEDDDLGEDEEEEDMDGDAGEEDEEEDEEQDEDELEEDEVALSPPDTDVEDHEEHELEEEYDEDMAEEDEEEEDEWRENRIIEVRWRDGANGFNHVQVLGHADAGSNPELSMDPFQGMNIDYLFGAFRRSGGMDRRRTFERSGSESARSMRHPLLTRPNLASSNGWFGGSPWTAGGTVIGRDADPLLGGSDVTRLFMYDGAMIDHVEESLFGDRGVGGQDGAFRDIHGFPRLGRRTSRADSRFSNWTDDGQLQGGAIDVALAHAFEEQFLAHVSTLSSADQPTTELATIADTSEPVSATIQSNQTAEDREEAALEPAVMEQQGDVPSGENNDSQIEQVLGSSSNTGEGHRDVIANADNDVDMHDGRSGPAEAASQDSSGSGATVGESLRSLEVEIGSADGHDENDRPAGSAELCPQPRDTPASGMEGSLRRADADENMDGSAVGISSGTGAPLQPPPGEDASRTEAVAEEHTGERDDTLQRDGGDTAMNLIDPAFLEALPEDLRAEVLASQQTPAPRAENRQPSALEDIDPEFLAALPPEIQAEVLQQQQAQRLLQAQQVEGQPVDMDSASIIATFPDELREEVLLTSSESVLAALPPALLAEARLLRERAMSQLQARSIFGAPHRLGGLNFDAGRRSTSGIIGGGSKLKEGEGKPLVDTLALKALLRLLRLAQPLGKGLLQRLLYNLCSHSSTCATLVHLLLEMLRPDADVLSNNGLSADGAPAHRLYGCQWNVVYARPQPSDGVPPLVSRRVLEILTYLAKHQSLVASLLLYFDKKHEGKSDIQGQGNEKGKWKVDDEMEEATSDTNQIPLILLLKLLNQPLYSRSSAHLEQVLGLIDVVTSKAREIVESRLQVKVPALDSPAVRASLEEGQEPEVAVAAPTNGDAGSAPAEPGSGSDVQARTSENLDLEASTSSSEGNIDPSKILLSLPSEELCQLCLLLAREGLSDLAYSRVTEVLNKIAELAPTHRRLFIMELADAAKNLSGAAVSELQALGEADSVQLSTASMVGAAILRVLLALSSLKASAGSRSKDQDTPLDKEEDDCLLVVRDLNASIEPLWQALSTSAVRIESRLVTPNTASTSDSQSAAVSNTAVMPPLSPGAQRVLPFIEGFFVLCDKLRSAPASPGLQELGSATACEIKETASSASLPESASMQLRKSDEKGLTFVRFADRHRRLLNAFVRQNPGLLEKSLSLLLKTPRLIDFDNKRAYFKSRIRQQHEQQHYSPLRISVRRAYVLEDSYNQLRMRTSDELKGRLTVQFQGEEGIDAGGLTREWYQLLSRVIFDKGALLFTTVGNESSFQPNPNSVYQTEHLSYFKFVGRVVAKALFDGQLLDVYFTRSFYKHILGVKVTYHDIEAVDPDFYKNLKWVLENTVNDGLGLTFSIDADEEKHILYERTEVMDHELVPGGRNIRVTEENKHEYVDLVAEHRLTTAIRPQINAFLEGFNELVSRELIAIFNDKELELLISGLPEIDLEDLKANTEYTGYTAASPVVQWFWEVVHQFNKEDMARLLQFITGTSKVPLEGFQALQGISGPQRFQIHKAYGAPERLPSAHTCFNQLDFPEYSSKDQLQERLLLAIHEASEGFGFG